VLRKTVTALAAAALAFGLGACGEDRSGEVKFEGDTGTETTPTATETTGTTETTTIPTTQTTTTP
jgi:hypothetical protein